MHRMVSGVTRVLLGAAMAATLATQATAQGNRTISGDWQVVTFSSGCKAILANELEMAWGPHANATFSWNGQCDQRGLMTGQGKLTTTFTSAEGTTFRMEKTGVAADGVFQGMTSEATYSNADDWDDRTPAGTMQLHDFGDVRNPMPAFYRDGCIYHVSDGQPDMSSALFDCQASAGAALRNQMLAPSQQAQSVAPPAVSPRAGLSQFGGQQAAASTPAPAAPEVDATPANDCLDVDSGVFSNSCAFPVYFTMCNESPKKGSWAESFSCVNASGKMDGFLDDIDAKSTTAAHASSTGMVYWFACRQPLTPKGIEYRQGQGIYAYCG
jgi:hypothetical protein